MSHPLGSHESPCQGTLTLPPDLVLLSVLFPFPPETVTTQIDDFTPLLPSYRDALTLIDLYFAHTGWWYVMLCLYPSS